MGENFAGYAPAGRRLMRNLRAPARSHPFYAGSSAIIPAAVFEMGMW